MYRHKQPYTVEENKQWKLQNDLLGKIDNHPIRHRASLRMTRQKIMYALIMDEDYLWIREEIKRMGIVLY